MPHTNTLHILRKNLAFQGLTEEILCQIIEQSEQVFYRTQQIVLYENDKTALLYVVLSGCVAITTINEDGTEIVIAHLKASDYFGELSLFNQNRKCHASASVCAGSHLLIIAIETFHALVFEQKEVVNELRRVGIARIREQLLKQSVIFQTITASKPKHINHEKRLKDEQFQENEVVFREGDDAERFYLILEGAANVYQNKNGKETLVAHLVAGNYFGELALIECEQRSATIVAKTHLKTVSLGCKRFLEYYQKSPKIREYIQSLTSFYNLHLKDVGSLTLHKSHFMNKPSLNAMHHFQTGVKVASIKVIAEDIFKMTRLDKVADKTVLYKKEGNSRELCLSNANIVGVTAVGNWPDLGRVYQHIIQQSRLYPWQLALFRNKGELWLEPETIDLNDGAVICQCTGVTRATLNRAIADGLKSINQLAKCTGVSLVCGACRPLLAEITGCSDMQQAQSVKVIALTENVKSFRFRPRLSPVKSYLPGQHIRIEAEIDKRWVQRSYTLTSPAQQQDYYEITVKREANGLFSNWLHNQLHKNSTLRVSEPQGQFHINPDTQKPIVFFAGGIGITPALSILHAVSNQQRQVYIEYSAARQNQFIYKQLLNQYNQEKNITVKLRATRQQGRLSKDEVLNIVNNYKQADFYICGPKAFEQIVHNFLLLAKVPAKKIYIESFNKKEALKNNDQQNKLLLLIPLLTLLFVFLFFILKAVPPVQSIQTMSPEFLWNDFFWQQVSGYCVLGFSVLGLAISLRKRVSKINFSVYDNWKILHYCTGFLSLIILALHTGLAIGTNYNRILLLCFLGVVLMGGLSAVLVFLEKFFPTALCQHIKRYFIYGHIVMACSLPVFLGIHIFSAYYFN